MTLRAGEIIVPDSGDRKVNKDTSTTAVHLTSFVQIWGFSGSPELSQDTCRVVSLGFRAGFEVFVFVLWRSTYQTRLFVLFIYTGSLNIPVKTDIWLPASASC